MCDYYAAQLNVGFFFFFLLPLRSAVQRNAACLKGDGTGTGTSRWWFDLNKHPGFPRSNTFPTAATHCICRISKRCLFAPFYIFFCLNNSRSSFMNTECPCAWKLYCHLWQIDRRIGMIKIHNIRIATTSINFLPRLPVRIVHVDIQKCCVFDLFYLLNSHGRWLYAADMPTRSFYYWCGCAFIFSCALFLHQATFACIGSY